MAYQKNQQRPLVRQHDGSGSPFLRYLYNWFEVIAIAIFVALVLKLLVVQSFRVNDLSMAPTLWKHTKQTKADFVLVNKLVFGARIPFINVKIKPLREPLRGEIVIVRDKKEPDRLMMLRVVGLPHEVVEYKNHTLYIDGNKADENYLSELTGQYYHHTVTIPKEIYSVANARRIPLKAGQFYLLGDNRTGARDSRQFGAVTADHIEGKVFFIYSPIRRIGSIP